MSRAGGASRHPTDCWMRPTSHHASLSRLSPKVVFAVKWVDAFQVEQHPRERLQPAPGAEGAHRGPRSSRGRLREAAGAVVSRAAAWAPPLPPNKLEQHRRHRQAGRNARFAEAARLCRAGMGTRAIARDTGLARGTPRGRLLGGRPSIVDAFPAPPASAPRRGLPPRHRALARDPGTGVPRQGRAGACLGGAHRGGRSGLRAAPGRAGVAPTLGAPSGAHAPSQGRVAGDGRGVRRRPAPGRDRDRRRVSPAVRRNGPGARHLCPAAAARGRSRRPAKAESP